MKYIGYLLILVLTAGVGFIIHVIEVEWLAAWVSQQMAGQSVAPSWEVRYVAMALSIEHSLAMFIIYLLLRLKIGHLHTAIQILALSGLTLAFKSLLLRQPIMDYLIGNPLHVVALQNAAKWLIPLCMATIMVIGYQIVQTHLSQPSDS